jgi:hypothetical protein
MMGALSDDGRDDYEPREPKARCAPRIDPWRARCIAGTWYVSRRVGDTIENLKHPPLGYKDRSTLASYTTERDAIRAAAMANAEKG